MFIVHVARPSVECSVQCGWRDTAHDRRTVACCYTHQGQDRTFCRLAAGSSRLATDTDRRTQALCCACGGLPPQAASSTLVSSVRCALKWLPVDHVASALYCAPPIDAPKSGSLRPLECTITHAAYPVDWMSNAQRHERAHVPATMSAVVRQSKFDCRTNRCALRSATIRVAPRGGHLVGGAILLRSPPAAKR